MRLVARRRAWGPTPDHPTGCHPSIYAGCSLIPVRSPTQILANGNHSHLKCALGHVADRSGPSRTPGGAAASTNTGSSRPHFQKELNLNTTKALSVRKEKEQLKKYRAGLLKNPMTKQIIEKSLQVAMDDTHPGQMTAMKMIMDRALPVAGFSAENRQANERGAIQINITGLSVPSEKEVGEVLIDQTPEPDE